MERLKLKILEVSLLLETGDLKRVSLDGRKDILSHPDVQHFIDNRNGRIVAIGGEMVYKDTAFEFSAGYTNEGFGKIRIKKKGERTGNLDVIQEAFEFLYNIYKKFFF